MTKRPSRNKYGALWSHSPYIILTPHRKTCRRVMVPIAPVINALNQLSYLVLPRRLVSNGKSMKSG